MGDHGLKATEGTLTNVDKGAKTIAVKTADGSENTFRLSNRVVKDSGNDIASAADKSGKMTVYYAETAGKKTAHFIKKAL